MYVPRSSSLNAVANSVSYDIEFSEDDQMPIQVDNNEEQIPYELMNLVANEIGAARSRGAPKRKTKSRASKLAIDKKRAKNIAAVTNQSVATGIRSRRKLREPTPDVEVDIE